MDPKLIILVIAALAVFAWFTRSELFLAAAAGVGVGACLSCQKPSVVTGGGGKHGKYRQGKSTPHRDKLPVVVEDSPNIPSKSDSPSDPNSRIRRRHHGQRKLFLSELAAFNEICRRFLDSDATSKIHVVYIGSAPGHHIPTLMECFPNFTWDLRDPRNFWKTLTDDKRVKYTTGYFKDKDAEALADGSVDFVISDIRRDKKAMGDQWENSIWEDMQMQKRWVEIIKPKYGSLIKMRLPWCGNPDQNCKPELANATKLEYLDGMNMFQMFAGVSSQETRLLSFPPFNTREYDLKEVETRTDYFNRVWREQRNYDIRREYELWEDYLKLKTPEMFRKMSTNDAKGWFLQRMKAWMRDYSEWSKTVDEWPEDK